MAKSTSTLTKARIDRAAPKQKDYFLWDGDLTGFGLKVSKGGRKSYVVKYRVGTGRKAPSKRMTIGQHGSPWTVKLARDEARKILGRVANGENPAEDRQAEKKQLTVNELCDAYIVKAAKFKKPSTLATDKGRIERHIKPLIGKKRINDITRKHIKRLLNDIADGKTAVDVKTGHRGRAIVKGGKGTASRTVGLLGGIFSYAVDQDLLESNPVRGVKRFADKSNQRFLNQVELLTLGGVLQDADVNPMALAILKLLIFTGARKGEIETLTWKMVDFEGGYLRLPDSKTGEKVIHLNAGALQVLNEYMPMKVSEFVFPAVKGDSYYLGTPKVWKTLKQQAGLSDVRLHDLRHSFASIAVSGGASLPMIGALLGHKNTTTTQKYAHLQDDPIKATNQRVGAILQASLMPKAINAK
ncbi:MAG: tyrosine-type recombinase/integrase [Alphaproteobacteria bacterium]